MIDISILNPSRQVLVKAAQLKENAIRLNCGALSVETGKYTGRSPHAKHIVVDSLTSELVDWKNNSGCTSEEFNVIRDLVTSKMNECDEVYVQQVFAGSDPQCRIKVEITTTLAWQSIFVKNMFIEPNATELESYGSADWKLFCCPSASKEPKVMVSFEKKEIYICGTFYAGEIKKSIFTVLNFILPESNILPMHCSVNEDISGENATVFFGLSGTGKTTLSADASRSLIGDDEHGWSNDGLFNFEGGCYAKVINLSKFAEPEIWDACQNSGAVLENVVIKDGRPDFSDNSLTENTRGSYDLARIKNASKSGMTGHPKNVVFLTCDAFGVLPPVSKLSPKEATEHFMMGYTAKVAGTESGVTKPEATFSHCFGAPFMPLPAKTYASLLRARIEEHNVDCWLVNTGWTGGPYGTGNRMPIAVSREIINQIVSGELANKNYVEHELTKLMIPTDCEKEVNKYLRPENTWEDFEDYKTHAKNLMSLFAEKLESFES